MFILPVFKSIIKLKNIEMAQNVCRLCMGKEVLEDVFKEKNLTQWISDLLSIQISTEDRMSHAICFRCRQQVNRFRNYRIHCQLVQGIMQTMIQCESVQVQVTDSNISKPPEIVNRAYLNNVTLQHEARRQLSDHLRDHAPKTSEKGTSNLNKELDSTRDAVKEHVSEFQEVEKEPFNETSHAQKFENNQNLRKSPITIEFEKSNAVKLEPCPEDSAHQLKQKETIDIEKDNKSGKIELSNGDMVTIIEVKLETVEDDTKDVKTECDMFEEQSIMTEDVNTNKNVTETDICEFVNAENETYTIQSMQENQCDVCRKEFSDSIKLKRHKRIHKPKIHVCQICGMSFAARFFYQKHQEIHLPRSERLGELIGRPFSCKLCSKTFKSQNRLAEHRSEVHMPNTLECHICDQKFVVRSVLMEHLRLHTVLGDTKEGFAGCNT